MVSAALLLTGCSTDEQEDSAYVSSMAAITEDASSAKVVTRPFKSAASGDWFIVESSECGDLFQFTLLGTGNATHMGLVDIEGRLCAFPPANIYFLTVTYTAANGDEITWQSVEVKINDEGVFAGGTFECIDGTGRFSEATGSIEVDEFLTVTEIQEGTGLPLAGLFDNTSKGWIRY